jgi:uncharacterized protein (DUF983 family)
MLSTQLQPSRNGQNGPSVHRPGLFAQLWAVVRQRCPRCREGRIFRGSFTMNDPCPVCGLVFQREEGYFLGAMYVSYLLACVLLGTSYFIARLLFPDLNSILLVAVASVPYLPLTPAVFRYSRVIWIHFERWVCPSDVSAGWYERSRQNQARKGP